MSVIYLLLSIGGVITAIVGLANGPSWVLVIIGGALTVLFFSLFRMQVRNAQGIGWMMRGIQSAGTGNVAVGIGQLGNAVSILRSRNQVGDLGVAELMLACALAVDGRPSEAQEHLTSAKAALEDPHSGAYVRKPSMRPRFEHMVDTLETHLRTGTPGRIALHAMLFN